jgi:hypothetical protein
MKQYPDYPDPARYVDDPMELIKIFEAHSYIKEKQGEELERKKKWNFKLARYLAYCLNEGLMGGRFGIKDLILILASNVMTEIIISIAQLKQESS